MPAAPSAPGAKLYQKPVAAPVAPAVAPLDMTALLGPLLAQLVAQPAPVAAAPAPVAPVAPQPVATLTPEDINYFDTQARRLTQGFDQGSARNAFQRGSLQQNQAADLESLNNRFNTLRGQLPGSFANRGLLNSGVYHQGLKEYGQQRQTATDQVNRQYGQQLGALTLGDQQLGQQYTQGLQDTEATKQARRQSIAASLRSSQ